MSDGHILSAFWSLAWGNLVDCGSGEVSDVSLFGNISFVNSPSNITA